MPTPPPPPLEMTRRAVLTAVAVGAGAVVAGCTIGSDGSESGGASDGTSQVDPDVALAGEALAGEQAALAALEATVARHSALKRTLSPMVDAHRAHSSLLAQAAPEDSPSPAAPGSPDASPGPFRVPADSAAALRRLLALELALSTSAKRHSFAAESGGFARLLASLAASAGQHAALLAPAASSDGAPS